MWKDGYIAFVVVIWIHRAPTIHEHPCFVVILAIKSDFHAARAHLTDRCLHLVLLPNLHAEFKLGGRISSNITMQMHILLIVPYSTHFKAIVACILVIIIDNVLEFDTPL